jgi:hypothetical protein
LWELRGPLGSRWWLFPASSRTCGATTLTTTRPRSRMLTFPRGRPRAGSAAARVSSRRHSGGAVAVAPRLVTQWWMEPLNLGVDRTPPSGGARGLPDAAARPAPHADRSKGGRREGASTGARRDSGQGRRDRSRVRGVGRRPCSTNQRRVVYVIGPVAVTLRPFRRRPVGAHPGTWANEGRALCFKRRMPTQTLTKADEAPSQRLTSGTSEARATTPGVLRSPVPSRRQHVNGSYQRPV